MHLLIITLCNFIRSEEHTSELQSRFDLVCCSLHSFPTRRSSDLQHWLETVSPNFPSSAVIAIILGFVVSYNPMQYFLREPDQVFLMVKEREMDKYFRYALTYNYFVQLY